MKRCLVTVAVLLALVVLAAPRPVAAAEALTGPLADYVSRADDSYKWQVRREGTIGATKYAELTLTSQTWRGIIWRHQLFVLLPSSTPEKLDHALLFIAGGRWRDELAAPPAKDEKLPRDAQTLALVAENLKTPVAVLLHVPQQPMFDGKVEDQIIAMTFENYLRSGDADWPLLLPMVKSAVRGMDATQAFAKEHWKREIRTFTVTGASKRGWTTWLTGAVDARAVALAPMVIDVLNMGPQMKHQKETFGDLSDEVNDYKERRLDEALDTPRGQQLLKIVDPYAYRARLTQPKMIILGTNDRYWPLDALNLYWDGLPDNKHVLYVPNNGHGLQDLPRIIGAVHVLQRQVVHDKPLPKLNWEHEVGNGKLSLAIKSEPRPAFARAWIARSVSKDFREARWESVELTIDGKDITHAIPLPEKGYAAMFGELEFKDADVPYFLSSQVKIVGPEEKAAE